MEKAKNYTHIVPVGFSSDKLIASLKQFPAHKIIILTHHGDENNPRVKRAVDDIKEAFKSFEILDKEIERENVLDSSLQILSIIEKEVKSGSIVKINISGGLRNIGISAYIVSLVSDVPIYTDIPESTGDNAYHLKGILDIPLFPIKELAKEQISIFEELEDGVESVDVLISRLKPELEKGTADFGNERSRLSHHIRKLKEAGFIDTEKSSKNLAIRKSKLGEIYMKGRDIKRSVETQNSE
jgi:DNA-binding transcriptional ArsR family regulator